MKNIYHSDIYKFQEPVKSYWEDTTKENFNLSKLTKDISSEVVVIGGGYTGLLCAINLIENYNLDVILLEAGKVGWGASSRNGGFCSFPPIKISYKKLQKIYGKDETKKFFKNSVEGSNYTKDIISNYNIDCDVTGDCNFILAHHPNKFQQIKEQAEVYKNEFGIEANIYSKEEFDKIGHTGTLDPFATGVLVLAIGSATKLIQYIPEAPKMYEMRLQLGMETETADCDGDLVRRAKVPYFSTNDIQNLAEQFTGRIAQKPPLYSAIKVKGKRLYEYARAGIPVEIPQRYHLHLCHAETILLLYYPINYSHSQIAPFRTHQGGFETNWFASLHCCYTPISKHNCFWLIDDTNPNTRNCRHILNNL